MDTRPLELFATQARRELIASVEAQASAVLSDGSVARSERGETVNRLEAEIEQHGQKHVIDKVAYTWFNRLIALRYMDALGYTGVGVVSPTQGHAHGQPEILADAKRGHLDDEVIVNEQTRDAVMGLLDGSRRSTDPEGEAYALLLTEYCRFWNKAMPFMFEREGDYTELLVPSGLLADGSILSRAREVLSEDVCEDVEVIGWLYQFYISERKDEVFAGFKKNKKAGADEIPAATQLFTPHWIVRYLVENSLGRLWMLNKPGSRLVEQMDYYIAPVDETPDFLKINGPEELTVIDPACGSGHMLTYAFDLLYEIYAEEGYAPSEIPSLILTHNLHGTEIDPRAGALAAFALTMKARRKDRRFLSREVEPRVCVIEPISFESNDLDFLVTKSGDRYAEEAFWNQFRDADILGSLIRPVCDEAEAAAAILSTLQEDLLYGQTVQRARRVVHQAEMLSAKYAVVVANPPYMGRKQMNSLLSQFMKDEYPDSKSDLFAGFIERLVAMVKPHGYMAQVTMQSWMFLSSYEKLRSKLQRDASIVAMLHMDNMVMRIAFGTSATVWEIGGDAQLAGKYTWIALDDLDGDAPRLFPARNARNSTAGPDGYFTVAQSEMTAIPGSPVVYWLSEKMRDAFTTGNTLGEVASLAVGLQTGDNNRFLRLWWEVSDCRTAFTCTSREEAAASGARWFPYNKGGEFRKWYGNHDYLLNWEHDGAAIIDFRPRSVIRNPGTYFQASLAWSDISSGTPSFRRFPAGFIHGNKGNSAFGREALLDRLAMIMNSNFATEVLSALSPTMTNGVGDVEKMPLPNGVSELPDRVNSLVANSKADWNSSETSWAFERNPVITLFKRE